MAGFASGREICGYMVGIGGLLIILQVAGSAGGRKSLILPDRSFFVTRLAFHCGVRAKQWKSVEVLPNRLDRHLPAENRVTLGAVCAELTAVDVRMAIRAVLADIGKNRLQVALYAVDFFVHTAKGISRGVVIKFGDGADGAPTGARVAILAWDGQRPVRTPCGLPLGIRRTDKT